MDFPGLVSSEHHRVLCKHGDPILCAHLCQLRSGDVARAAGTLVLFGSLCNAEDLRGSLPGVLHLHHSGFKPGLILFSESPQLW